MILLTSLVFIRYSVKTEASEKRYNEEKTN